ncbi:MAG: glycerol-3-phosphate cytidyltransferase TagD [uncultured bacterium]|nr:MAG: glycerol-3-phosphate cytidyltransferase TagD [uncultured bacterium]
MSKILNFSDLGNCPLPTVNYTLVLVGGCFDLLHIGHLFFLEEAKKHGETLCILLEPDSKLKKKGEGRPIHDQRSRAKILEALTLVDLIILLPESVQNKDYDHAVKLLNPKIIATTENDQNSHHKSRTASLVSAKLVLIPQYQGHSSTSLINKLSEI